MKLLILFASLVVGTFSEDSKAPSTTIPVTTSESSNRRSGVSYSTNVIHRNPDHPEKDAESSINFQLNLNDFDKKQSNSPPSTSTYPHVPEKYSSHSTESSPADEEKSLHHYIPHSDSVGNDPQQQSDVYYESNYPPNNQLTYFKSNSHGQPIISETTHKFEVQHPTPQYKQSGQKAGNPSRPRYKNSKQHRQHGQTEGQSKQPQALTIVQAVYPKQDQTAKPTKIISYEHSPMGQTQSFNVGYSMKFGHDGSKKQVHFKPTHQLDADIITGNHKEEVNQPSHLGFVHPKNTFVSSPLTQEEQLSFLNNPSKQPNYTWKNLSPTVEIYRSKDIAFPVAGKNDPNFDHEKAIGKSEGFDYTNAVEYLLEAQKVMTKNAQSHDGHDIEQYVQAQPPMHLDAQATNISPPKFPLYTGLLQDPYLSPHKDSLQSKHPIHFDPRLLQEYQNMLKERDVPQSTSDGPAATNSLSHIRTLLAEQSQQQNAYRLIPTTAQVEQSLHSPLNQPTPATIYFIRPSGDSDATIAFKYPKNGLLGGNTGPKNHLEQISSSDIVYVPMTKINKPIDPTRVVKHMKPYKVKEMMNDHVQPQQVKFKVFGKPGNMFMRNHYEKVRVERPIRVQQSSQKRLVRDYSNIEMDLRPPPRTAFLPSNFQSIQQ